MGGPADMVIEYTQIALTHSFEWSEHLYWYAWSALLFLGCMLSLAPWRLPAEHHFLDLAAHVLRQSIFWCGILLLVFLAINWWFYWLVAEGMIEDYNARFFKHYGYWAGQNWSLLLGAPLAGIFVRFYYFRFFHPYLSGVLRDWRNLQTTDEISDIRDERLKYVAKDYLPSKFYDPKGEKILVGLDSDSRPLFVPLKVWRQTNTQIIGPTRFGKGVAIGCIMDQIIRLGDLCIYIDPKEDEWAPHVMYQAAKAAGKPFYYVTLHDKGIGYWSPFDGGTRRDAYARLVTIFGMVEAGGESDFYKIVEKMQLNRIISPNDPYDLKTLYSKITAFNSFQKNPRDKAIKVEALLENWRQIESLNPPAGATRFSVEKALLEDAVVYVQGSLNDDVVKTATKALIMEIIQEAMRLKKDRAHHGTLIIDEMSFLVSKQVRDALATIVGFNMNVVSMYQAPNDLKFPDDKTLDGQALLQSMNVNSQIKLVYGGADYETAEWLSNLSGTITKSVTAMEKTNVRSMGAEEWERGRMVKHHEEAAVPINVVLSLPPRVAILIQPHQLATPCFTSPAKVNDLTALPGWLAQEERRQAPALEHAQVSTSNSPAPAEAATAGTFDLDAIIAEGMQNTSRENLVWALGKKQRPALQTRISKEDFDAAVLRLEQLKAADEQKAGAEQKLEHAQVSASAEEKKGPPPPKYDLETVLATPKDELTPDQCIWLFKTPSRTERAKGMFTEEEAALWKKQASIRKGQASKEPAEPAPLPATTATAEDDDGAGRSLPEAADEMDMFEDDDDREPMF